MAAGKELLGSYKPRMIHAGDYPVVKDTGVVADGNTILELMPVTMGTDGKLSAITQKTAADVYGIAAASAEAGEMVVIYLTGEFFGDSLELPEGMQAADIKAACRRNSIFLKDTDMEPAASGTENDPAGEEQETEGTAGE